MPQILVIYSCTQAYRRLVQTDSRTELPLPGLNLSGNQLFFLNFAQVINTHNLKTTSCQLLIVTNI